MWALHLQRTAAGAVAAGVCGVDGETVLRRPDSLPPLPDRCEDPQLRPVAANLTLPVWVGVDASVKRDATALVAVTWDRETRRVRVVCHRIFQPSAKDPLDFER